MTCRVPANQMIYQALLNKAASYPADKNYQAAAYRNAAESVAAWFYDLRKDYILAVPNVGPSIAKFITDFNNHPCSISFCSTCEAAATPTKPIEPNTLKQTQSTPTCIVPHNQTIYELLMNKAEHEKQKAADYKATAEALLTWDDNLLVRYYEMRDDVISFILDEHPLDGCSSEIASFIEQQLDALTSKKICSRCTPKGSEPRCYCGNPPY